MKTLFGIKNTLRKCLSVYVQTLIVLLLASCSDNPSQPSQDENEEDNNTVAMINLSDVTEVQISSCYVKTATTSWGTLMQKMVTDC